MSTIEDFENAPIGATATSPDGRQTYRRASKTQGGADWANDKGEARLWADADGLAHFGYTLGPAPAPAPTTAREALDLAWELAHPVKEGQYIPEGVRLLDRSGRNDLSAYATRANIIINAREALTIRTRDPLPDPEPDWLNAPAVIAVCNDVMDRAVFVRENEAGTRWVRDTRFYRWDELTDVTPLWPKEDAAHSFHHDEPWCTWLGGEPA